MKPYEEVVLKRQQYNSKQYEERKHWRDLWEIFWETYYRTKFHNREALFRYFQETYMQDTFTNNKSQAIYINFPIVHT